MTLNQSGSHQNSPPLQQKPAAAVPRVSDRTKIFVFDLVLLAILILLGALNVLFHVFSLGRDPYKLVIESMWFGALGGVVISLKGIYDHAGGTNGWDSSFDLWHIGRPASGAVAGLMTVVLLQAVNANGELTRPVVYAAAFIFGTQERRFFNFLYEVARLIVHTPGETGDKTLRLTGVRPAEGSPGNVMVITGQGMNPTAIVKLGSAAVEKLTVSADGTSAAAIIPPRPTGADTVDVVITNNTGMSFTLSNGFKFIA